MLMNELTFVTENRDIIDVIATVQTLIESELTTQQLDEFHKWKFELVEEINEELTDEIIIEDVEDFYNQYVEPVVNHFNVDLDFSFLKSDVVEELTELQIISVIKRINNITTSNSENVTLSRLRDKYRQSKTFLKLSFLVDEIDILQILNIAQMQSPVNPVNVDGEIIDSSRFVVLTGDGRWSDRSWEIKYDPRTKRLYEKTWSQWQGEGTFYRQITLQDFLDIIKNTHDVSHLRRHIRGLKKYLTELQ